MTFSPAFSENLSLRDRVEASLIAMTLVGLCEFVRRWAGGAPIEPGRPDIVVGVVWLMLALAIWWRGRTYDDLVRFSWVVVIFMLVGEVVRVVTCVFITQALAAIHGGAV
jgi:hypothetical protein